MAEKTTEGNVLGNNQHSLKKKDNEEEAMKTEQ